MTMSVPMDSVDTPGLPPLNFDILVAIMAVAHGCEVSRLMRTCSTLYHSGAKFLLSEPVCIMGTKHLISFCFFMVAEKRARFRYLRSLVLSTGVLHESAARGLGLILRRTTHLESLKIVGAQDLLRSDRDLADAISGLESLRHLEIDDATDSACRMLRSMRSKLVSLKLSFGYVAVGGSAMETFYETIDPDELPEYHPVALCASFTPTLESLVVSYPNTAGTEMWGLVSPPVYPNLRSLELQDEWPLMRPYIRAFPNLTRLTIFSNRSEYSDDLGDMTEWFEENRQVNMEDQLVNAQWHHLEEYSGALIGLYLAGLACRIPRLKLLRIEDEHLELLGPVLDDAKPAQLEMVVHGLLFDDAERSICSVLRRDVCRLLTKLVLSVEICCHDKDRDVVSAMENLLDTLMELSLEHLELKLRPYFILDPSAKPEPHTGNTPHSPDGVCVDVSAPHTPTPFVPTMRSLERFNTQEYAYIVFGSLPTLKGLSIGVDSLRDCGRREVRLKRGDNGQAISIHDACM